MRRIALVLISFFCAASARAELISFEYTGVINTLREVNMSTNVGRLVVTSNIVPGGVRVGDDFHGVFTLDTDLPLNYSDSGSASYFDMNHTSKAKPDSMIFDKTGASVPTVVTAQGITVNHSKGYDNLSFSMAGFSSVGVSFGFSDTASILSGLAIPSDIDLSAWSYAEAALFWADMGSNRYLTMNGMLTSVTKVSAVPEPTSYAMLLAGLALVSGIAARRKQQRG